MKRDEFDKLQTLYDQIIELTCIAKESSSTDVSMAKYLEMMSLVTECLEFSPYTHFYTQVLIDLIVKTYNAKKYRSDLLIKSNIEAQFSNPFYYPDSLYIDIGEDEYSINNTLHTWAKSIGKLSKRKKIKYRKYFETIRDLLIYDLIKNKEI